MAVAPAPTAVVLAHVAATLVALALIPVVVRAAAPLPGGARALPRHRALGRVYGCAWLVLGATGAWLGARRPGVSAFELLNAIGLTLVAAGTLVGAVPAVRRRLGAGWFRLHVRLMLSSTAFLVVATANQILSHLVGGYPMWVFWLMVAAPAFVLPRIGRRLAARAAGTTLQPVGRTRRPETGVPAAA